MVVTNASMIDAGRLAEFAGALDWIGLSIDSPIEATQTRLGRGKGDHVARVMEAARLVKEAGIRLKVNTVVTSANWQEDFHDLVRRLGPERWKVFQVLSIAGENDIHIQPLAVTKDQFEGFVARHAHLAPVAEDNEAMTGSYLMLDPLGRFYQNEGGRYQVSQPVLQVGVAAALNQTGWSDAKFIDRGGLYPWATPRGVA
jgi:radical S-adenosyl methionine domain-containing protein 2